MKKLLLIIFLLASLKLLAQPPANDLCQNAEDLPVTMNSNPIITVPGNCFGATATLDIPLSDTVCRAWAPVAKEVWFKFKATSSKGRFWFKGELNGFRYQLFSGSCNGMKQIFCRSFNILACCVDSANYPGFIKDSTYFIRVFNFENMNQVNLNFRIGMRFFDSGIIKSKITGGVWAQAATWEGNQVPTEYDSVQIVDGSTVLTSFGSSFYKMKWLKVGGDDTLQKAILNLRSSPFLTLEQGLVLTKGDSIICRSTNGRLCTSFANISTNGNLRIDGGINIRNLSLDFSGSTPITMDGDGSFVQKNFLGLANSNPNVNMYFGGILENALDLIKGNIHFHKPIVYNLRDPSLSFLPSGANNIYRFNGTFTGPLSYKMPINFIEQKGFVTYHYYRSNSNSFNPNEDTITRPGKEFFNGKFMRRLTLFRSRIDNVFYLDSTTSLRYFSTNKSPIRMRNPNDTLFAANFYMLSHDTARGYMDQGNICFWNDPAFGLDPVNSNLGNIVNVSRGGKSRNVSLIGSWWTVPDQKICVEVVPNSPGGTLPPTITTFAGHSVLQIKAARPIPVGSLKVEMNYWKSDNILANKKEIFIIQGLSANGPWKVVSKDTNAVYDFRITFPLDFANGYFFAFATSSQVKEMSAIELLPPPQYFQTGCGNSNTYPIGVIVQNKAVLDADNFIVGYQVQGDVAKSQFVSYPANKALKPLKTDTVWFEGALGQTLPFSELVPIKAWAKMTGDTVVKNDTIATKIDLRPNPFPYFINFDTIRINSRIQFVENIPYRWYDSLQYDKMLKFSTKTTGRNPYHFHVQNSDAPTLLSNKILKLVQDRLLTSQITTHRIGPIQKPALIELKQRIAYFTTDSLDRNDMITGDTLFVEGSEDCGENWRRIFMVHRNNRILNINKQWLRDSLTFSNGSFVSIRFRTTQFFRPTPPNIEIDSLRLYPGVLTTSTETISLQEVVRLYPNPSNGNVHLDLPISWAGTEKYMQIINMKGQQVFQSRFTETEKEIRLTDQAEGIYYIRVQAGNKLHAQKLVLKR